MTLCRLFYFLSIILYTAVYYAGIGWYSTSQDASFSYGRVIFLVATLLILDQYNLVPSPLSCPYFYTFYKALAALIIANVSLFTIWLQVEDVVVWLLKAIDSGLERLPKGWINVPLAAKANVIYWAHIVVAAFYLIWVIKSTGFLTQFKRSSTYAPQSGSSSPSSRRSRSYRCC